MGSCCLRRSVQSVAIGVVLLAAYSVFGERETLGKSTSVCTFSRIYDFRDSNSDTGSASAALGRVPPSYGRRFFGKASGRYSDGCLIIDFIGSESFAKALFAMDIGRNDLSGLKSMNEEQVKADVPRILDQFSVALEKLYKLGARWIHGFADPIGYCCGRFGVVECGENQCSMELKYMGIPAVSHRSTYLGIEYLTQKQQTNGYCIVFWMARFPNPKFP